MPSPGYPNFYLGDFMVLEPEPVADGIQLMCKETIGSCFLNGAVIDCRFEVHTDPNAGDNGPGDPPAMYARGWDVLNPGFVPRHMMVFPDCWPPREAWDHYWAYRAHLQKHGIEPYRIQETS